MVKKLQNEFVKKLQNEFVKKTLPLLEKTDIYNNKIPYPSDYDKIMNKKKTNTLFILLISRKDMVRDCEGITFYFQFRDNVDIFIAQWKEKAGNGYTYHVMEVPYSD